MNVTFDNNVLLSAFLWDGSVSQKLMFELIRRGDVKFYVSEDILNEFREVLKRDFSYADGEIEELVKSVKLVFEVISAKVKKNIVKADPDDDIVIACALKSKSSYIITYDDVLLKMKSYKNIVIITPEAARASI